MSKINNTKYIVLRLCDWYFEINPSKKSNRENDLSILKVLKLVFLLSPIEYKGRRLLDLDFKFEAWALGPVEVDVYNSKQNLNMNPNQRKVNYEELLNSFEDIIIDKLFLDGIINELKSKNKNLINLSATQLVDLTHKYSSWINSYSSLDDKIMKNDQIINEEKFYFL